MVVPDRSDYPLLNVKPDQSARIAEGLLCAGKAADFLRRNYQVGDVFLFGSLIEPERVHSKSDIDLAVRGLPEKYYYQAVGELLDMTEDFDVDVVDLDHCSDHIKNRILSKCRKI